MSKNPSGEMPSPPEYRPRQQALSRRALLGGFAAGLITVVTGGGALYTEHERTGWPRRFDNTTPFNPLAGDLLTPIKSYNPQPKIEVGPTSRYLDVLTSKDYLRWTLQ